MSIEARIALESLGQPLPEWFKREGLADHSVVVRDHTAEALKGLDRSESIGMLRRVLSLT